MRFLCCFGTNAVVPCCQTCAPLFQKSASELLLMNRLLKEERQKNNTLKANVEKLENEVRDLTSKDRNMWVTVQNEVLKKQLAEANRQLEHFEEAFIRECKCTSENEREIRIMHEELASVKKTGSDLKEEVKLLQTSNAALKTDVDRLKADAVAQNTSTATLQAELDSLKEFFVQQSTAAGWFDGHLCAFEAQVEEIIQQCDSVADGIVEKIKDARAIESAFPRVHKCPVCLEAKGFGEFSTRTCGHLLCTLCTRGSVVSPVCECCRAGRRTLTFVRLFV